MIDLHGHYLPWVDDGAQSLDEGLLMLQMAEADGIRMVVVTPKVEPGRWNNTRGSLERKFEAFRQIALRRGIAVELRLGAESIQGPETVAAIERGEVPMLGSWEERPVALLRWREDFIPIGAIAATQRLLAAGLLPMLAHPERNPGVVRSPAALDFFLRDGCLIQIDAGSVLGWYGAGPRDTAFRLIETGWATVMASGAHDANQRPPSLGRARRLVVERFGDEIARRLTELNPGKVTSADPVAEVPVLSDAIDGDSPAGDAARSPAGQPPEEARHDSDIPLLSTRQRLVERRPRRRLTRWSRAALSAEITVPAGRF